MNSDLQKIIEEVKNFNNNSDNFSHLTTFGPKSRWSIDISKWSLFWKEYCSLVSNLPNNNQVCLNLAERSKEIMPVVSDLIFRFDSEIEEPYEDRLIHAIIYCYQQSLKELFILSDEKKELYCCVTESKYGFFSKNKNNDKDYLTFIIRLQFPYCKINAKAQVRILLPRVVELLRSNNVINKANQTPIGSWDDIICQNATSDFLTLYGSIPEQGYEKLLYSAIYGEIHKNDVEEGNEIIPVPLNQIFIYNDHTHVQQGLVNSNMFLCNSDETFWLPMFLSVDFCNKITLPKTGENVPIITESKSINDNDNIALSLLNIIKSDKYFNEEHYWLNIGKSLHHYSSGRESGLKIWIDQTKKKSKTKTEDDCYREYYSIANNMVTIKTLGYYAREDNPNFYNNWHDNWAGYSLEKALTSLHTDVALAFYRYYWLDYVCSSSDGSMWYYYHNHKWNESPHGVDIKKEISDNFCKRIEKQRALLTAEIARSIDEGFRANGELSAKKMGTLISKLKTQSYKNQLLKELAEFFFLPEFDDLLDNNTELLGIHGGIIEFCKNDIKVRNGKPEDYTSRTCNTSYDRHLSYKDKDVKNLMDWLNKVFPDQELLRFFLKYSASCLRGRNSDKVFAIWTGSGNNSKSTIALLFEKLFAKYCIKFPNSLITQKGANSSAPTPELARAKGTRVAFLQEIGSDSILKTEKIKEYTGNDSFFTRFLHSNGGDVIMSFKLICMLNDPPAYSFIDPAIIDRTKILPFPSKWSKDAPKDPEEQYAKRTFEMDPFFDKKISKMVPAFLWLLVQYYPIYIAEGLTEPRFAKEITAKYWSDKDIYLSYIADNIIPDPNKTAVITLSQIVLEFQSWFGLNYKGTKPPNRNTLKKEFSLRWGEYDPAINGWRGIMLKNQLIVK